MIESLRLRTVPARAPTWLLGDQQGVQVWTVREAAPWAASVLIQPGMVVVLLAERLAGTCREGRVLRWAMALVAVGSLGYYELDRLL